MSEINKRNKLAILSMITSSILCGEGEVENEDSGNPVDVNSKAFKDAVSNFAKELAAKETDGLKNKNSDLLAKLTKANESAKQFEGLDLEKIKNMQSLFEKDEEMKLIAEGKFNEVIQKRTDAIHAEYNDKIAGLTKKYEASSENEIKYRNQINESKMTGELTKAAIKSGVLKEAIDDIVRRGLDVFKLNEAGELESRDKNGELRLTEEGLILNPERFVDTLKSSNPYYWAESESAGTRGSGDRTNGANADSLVQGAAMGRDGKIDMEAYRKARKKQSGEGYHGRSR